MSTLEKLFAEKLLKVKAIKLQPTNPFTWASGWKSPFYCDNRKTLSYPSLRNFVKLEISRLVLEQFGSSIYSIEEVLGIIGCEGKAVSALLSVGDNSICQSACSAYYGNGAVGATNHLRKTAGLKL